MVREVRLLLRGLIVEVVRFFGERLGNVGCDIYVYVIDFEEYFVCYVLLGGDVEEVFGWGVFDCGDRVVGFFMVVVVFWNVDEEDE